jgi:hypothetical protein
VNTVTGKVEGVESISGVMSAIPPMLICSANFPQFISMHASYSDEAMNTKGLQ